MIPRLIEGAVVETLKKQKKIVLILGARQVGKTVLLKNIQKKWQTRGRKTLYLNCDLEEEGKVIDTTSLTILRGLTKDVDLLLIDEVQRISNAGLTLKIINDNLPSIRVLATGSSSFDLKNKLSDALTGRYLDFTLYPFSLVEVLEDTAKMNKPLFKSRADALLKQTLTFGFYPEVFLLSEPAEKKILLEKIIESYLFKDIFSFQKIRNPQAIKDLSRAVSYQVGSEVNENELASRLKIDRKTVVAYLDLLEKSFVIKRLYPFSRNPRREIGRNYKIYFTDLGIRNALIGDFNSIEVRPDLGALWENFLIIERLKAHANKNEGIETNFWRSYGGAEIDYLERKLDTPKAEAFEFKYAFSNLSRGAKSFSKEYRLPVQLINTENYLDFIG